MKKTQKIIVLFLLIAILTSVVLSMTSCDGGGGLSGTYIAKIDWDSMGISEADYIDMGGNLADLEVSFTFSGNKITAKFGGETETGKYAIKGNILEITPDNGEDVQTIAYEKKGNSIFLDGQEFVKK